MSDIENIGQGLGAEVSFSPEIADIFRRMAGIHGISLETAACLGAKFLELHMRMASQGYEFGPAYSQNNPKKGGSVHIKWGVVALQQEDGSILRISPKIETPGEQGTD